MQQAVIIAAVPNLGGKHLDSGIAAFHIPCNKGITRQDTLSRLLVYAKQPFIRKHSRFLMLKFLADFLQAFLNLSHQPVTSICHRHTIPIGRLPVINRRFEEGKQHLMHPADAMLCNVLPFLHNGRRTALIHYPVGYG